MSKVNLDQLPEGVRVGNERLLQITESAVKKINNLLQKGEEGDYLRVSITGGGCNGLTYKTRFTDKLKSGDILILAGGIAAVVDSKSALYLKGSVLGYSHKMIAGGFKFSNPNAKSSCSCGESFSI